jgi:hypothetical protein
VVRGRIVKRRVSPKAIDKMKERVRDLTSRSKGWSFAEVLIALRRYLLGWKGYFGLAETPSMFVELDGWIRLRLRALIIKQCKHGPKVFRVLHTRGATKRDAAGAAAHCRRWWATAAHHAVCTAFPTQYFDTLGVPRLGPL